MALLIFDTPPAKNSSSLVTLDKGELLAFPEISSDLYWSGAGLGLNIKRVIVVYQSSPGNQNKRLSFDFSLSLPTTYLSISTHSRDLLQIGQIVLIDFDGGSLILNKATSASVAALSYLDLDVSGGGGGGGDLVAMDFIGRWRADNLNAGETLTSWPSETNSTRVGFIPPDTTIVGNPLVLQAGSFKTVLTRPVPQENPYWLGMGIDGAIYTGLSITSGDYTIIAVYNAIGSPSEPANAAVVGGDGESGLWIGESAANYNQPVISAGMNNYTSAPPQEGIIVSAVVVEGDGTMIWPYISGYGGGMNPSPTPMYPGALAMGHAAFAFMGPSPESGGFISELIVYDRALSNSEMTSIISTLMTKYVT